MADQCLPEYGNQTQAQSAGRRVSMEMKICQSCGMPMEAAEQFGTDADGGRNEDYCCYCYKNGEFEQKCTMEEMADFCAPFEVEGGRAKTKEEAKAGLMRYFATLKRWKKEV